MTSKTVAQLLVDLNVARSHSRSHVSNDNPYSEAAFKTLKYAPAFPGNFGSLADARAFSETFFAYYNHEHRHAGIGLHTPASVHFGTATEIRRQRQATLHAAYDANPSRFRHRRPEPPKLPSAAWINQPSREAFIQSNWSPTVSSRLTRSEVRRVAFGRRGLRRVVPCWCVVRRA